MSGRYQVPIGQTFTSTCLFFDETCLITDRVRSTGEGYVLTRVSPSIHLSVHT